MVWRKLSCLNLGILSPGPTCSPLSFLSLGWGQQNTSIGTLWTNVLFVDAVMGGLLGFQGTKKIYVEKEKQLPRHCHWSIWWISRQSFHTGLGSHAEGLVPLCSPGWVQGRPELAGAPSTWLSCGGAGGPPGPQQRRVSKHHPLFAT